MSNFNMDFNFVSTSRVEEITKRAFNINNLYINEKKVKKELKSKKSKNNKILDLKYFDISDIPYLTDDVKSMFEFKNQDFIVNYDILEEIKSNNSIGLYINKKDTKENKPDKDYISRAVNRLNKYVKQPKLFIFADKALEESLSEAINIDYRIISLYDWREEFLFLKECRHKILYNAPGSYSEGFWASALSDKDYNINIYNKKIKAINKKNNWIAV